MSAVVTVDADTGELIKYDGDAREIGDLFRKISSSLTDSVRSSVECGRRLKEKRKEIPHGGWEKWLSDNRDLLGFSDPATAWRLMKFSDRNLALTQDLAPPEALKLSREIWGNKTPANYSSESNEWYTPEEYIETVRAVLGAIDLDPASCEFANRTVQAAQIFTEQDDGLSREWFGRVFMNPPYGVTDDRESRAGVFCKKLIAEYQAGRVSEAIILVNSSHSQGWQRPLYGFPVCFVDHRIEFVDQNGVANPNPTFGNIFVYLGAHTLRFAEEFKCHGYCMEPIT